MESTNKSSADKIYQVVTNRLLSIMDKGQIPWRKPWETIGQSEPRNGITGHNYRGANFFFCLMTEEPDQRWLTWNQIKEAGFKVKKGAVSLPIVYWIWFYVDPKSGQSSYKKVEGWEKRCKPKYYRVFNVREIDGIEVQEVENRPEYIFEREPRAENFIQLYKDRPEIEQHPNRCFYNRVTDKIGMVDKKYFARLDEYYCTLFHELIHSTGSAKRLDRLKSKKFGDENYSIEELTAELGAAYVCAMVGINNERTEEQTAAYLQGWHSALRNDPKLFIQASQRAQKAVDYWTGTNVKFEEDEE